MRDLKLKVSKNCVLEGSGLDFGGPGTRFWRVRVTFSGVLDVLNGAKTAKNHQKPAKQELYHKWPDCQGWVGGGDPPRGVSIEFVFISGAPPVIDTAGTH